MNLMKMFVCNVRLMDSLEFFHTESFPIVAFDAPQCFEQ